MVAMETEQKALCFLSFYEDKIISCLLKQPITAQLDWTVQ